MVMCFRTTERHHLCDIFPLAVFFNLSHIRHLKSHLFAPEKWDLVGVASILRVMTREDVFDFEKARRFNWKYVKSEENSGRQFIRKSLVFIYEVWEHFRLKVRKVEGAKIYQTGW